MSNSINKPKVDHIQIQKSFLKMALNSSYGATNQWNIYNKRLTYDNIEKRINKLYSILCTVNQ